MVPLPEADGGEALRRRRQAKIIDADQESNDISSRLLVHFICAGTSALILSIAHLHPECWFVSLFALVPFLWRLNNASLPGSILLGVMLAACYAFVAFIGEILISPGEFFLKLLFLSLVFSIFGLCVNLAKKYIGFNPIFIAALWLPVEYILAHYIGLRDIFTFALADSGITVRFASLFGCLMVSFAIVLINSLILILIELVSNRDYSFRKKSFARRMIFYCHYENSIQQKIWYYTINPRAPPLLIRFDRVIPGVSIVPK